MIASPCNPTAGEAAAEWCILGVIRQTKSQTDLATHIVRNPAAKPRWKMPEE